MKTCPHCKEQVLDAATTCKHCGQEIGLGPKALGALVTLGLVVVLIAVVAWISIAFR